MLNILMLGDFGGKKRQKNKKKLLHECGFSKLKSSRTKKKKKEEEAR